MVKRHRSASNPPPIRARKSKRWRRGKKNQPPNLGGGRPGNGNAGGGAIPPVPFHPASQHPVGEHHRTGRIVLRVCNAGLGDPAVVRVTNESSFFSPQRTRRTRRKS